MSFIHRYGCHAIRFAELQEWSDDEDERYDDIYKHHETLPAYIFRYNQTATSPTNYYHFLNNEISRFNGPACSRNWQASDEVETQWCIANVIIEPKKYFTFLDESGMDINNLTAADKLLITIWIDT